MVTSRPTWWDVCTVAGILAMLLAPVVLLACLMNTGWWWSPEAEVPLDGGTDRVVLEHPGATYALWGEVSASDPSCMLRDTDGVEIVQAFVPQGERALVEREGIADPTGSMLFVAPADGVVQLRCATSGSTPPSLLGIGPALHPAAPVAADAATLLVGPAVFVLGVGATVIGRLGVRTGGAALSGSGSSHFRVPGRPRGHEAVSAPHGRTR